MHSIFLVDLKKKKTIFRWLCRSYQKSSTLHSHHSNVLLGLTAASIRVAYFGFDWFSATHFDLDQFFLLNNTLEVTKVRPKSA